MSTNWLSFWIHSQNWVCTWISGTRTLKLTKTRLLGFLLPMVSASNTCTFTTIEVVRQTCTCRLEQGQLTRQSMSVLCRQQAMIEPSLWKFSHLTESCSSTAWKFSAALGISWPKNNDDPTGM